MIKFVAGIIFNSALMKNSRQVVKVIVFISLHSVLLKGVIMGNFEKRQTIKEWELEKGIEIIKPTGFCGQKNKIWNRKYSEKLFKKCARLSEIKCKTDKGLKFLCGGN